MIVTSDFKPAPYLRHPHLQTVFAAAARRSPALDIVNERLELPDGDFLDLTWMSPGSPSGPSGPRSNNHSDNTPITIVLHGLTGSIESKYARGLLRQIQAQGWRGVLMNFRGASGEPNRLPEGYHSGETGDFDYVVKLLHQRHPNAPVSAVGYSLGGNVLLKWLGEQGADSLLSSAVAVSVPFDLELCARAINKGLSRIYQSYLLKGMRRSAEEKFARIESPFPLPDFAQLEDFYAFDDAFTAPLFGFADAREYYEDASSRKYLTAIKTPTLVIHAEDDPFMSPDVLPTAQELSSAIRLELSKSGGHVGFVAADSLGRPKYWLEERIPAFLRDQVAQLSSGHCGDRDQAELNSVTATAQSF